MSSTATRKKRSAHAVSAGSARAPLTVPTSAMMKAIDTATVFAVVPRSDAADERKELAASEGGAILSGFGERVE